MFCFRNHRLIPHFGFFLTHDKLVLFFVVLALKTIFTLVQ